MTSRGFLIRLGVVACVAVAVGTAVFKLRRCARDLRPPRGPQRGSRPTASGRTLISNGRRPPGTSWRRRDFACQRTRATASSSGLPTIASVSADFTHQLLPTFLLPRRQTASEDAEWVFCYGCDETTLDDRYRVIAQVEGGPMFGRAYP